MLSPILLVLLASTPPERNVHASIPAFARRYRVSCARCHTAAPKLNVMGEAFRLNGYRFPETEPVTDEEPTVPLGEEPWRDLWPRAIWPSDLPGSVPLALRVQLETEVSKDEQGRTGVDFLFPREIYLLGGGNLGEEIAVFFESEWSREEGLEVLQAKIGFQRVLPALGERFLNIWVGLQNLYLFTFADRQIDRAGRSGFLWQRFRSGQVPLPGSAGPVAPTNGFRLGMTQPTVEINGLPSPSSYYAIGVAQGGTETTRDNNRRKDVYFKLRYKFGGLRLDGTYGAGGGPVLGSFGQYLDRSLIVETFGYLGSEPDPAGIESRHRAVGVNARLLRGPLDVGVGFVTGRDDHPWGVGLGALRHESLFAKGEYLLYPWLIASVKAETFRLRSPERLGAPRQSFRQDHVSPGMIALIRQNVRLVAEADLFGSYEFPIRQESPEGFWVRLDFAF